MEGVVTPRVSVVMPAYNAAATIGPAVDSILRQTFSNLELIVINDGSTDETRSILEGYRDKRLLVLDLARNGGIADALNAGLSQAQGDLIARMDADDVSRPGRLAQQVAQFDSDPTLDIAGTFMATMGFESILWTSPTTNAAIRARLLFSTALYHPTVMMRRSLVERGLVYYKSNAVPSEDYELWTRLATDPTVRFANLPLPLLTYREKVGDSSSGDYSMRQRKLSEQVSCDLATKLSLIATSQQKGLWMLIVGADDAVVSGVPELTEFSAQLARRGCPDFEVTPDALRAELRQQWFAMGRRRPAPIKIFSAITKASDPFVRSYILCRISNVLRAVMPSSGPLRWAFRRWQRLATR